MLGVFSTRRWVICSALWVAIASCPDGFFRSSSSFRDLLSTSLCLSPLAPSGSLCPFPLFYLCSSLCLSSSLCLCRFHLSLCMCLFLSCLLVSFCLSVPLSLPTTLSLSPLPLSSVCLFISLSPHCMSYVTHSHTSLGVSKSIVYNLSFYKSPHSSTGSLI